MTVGITVFISSSSSDSGINDVFLKNYSAFSARFFRAVEID
nr:hypothetical protein [uncultured Methanobrevibacter sp.]